jgi:polyhydroxybutyrate depolymerase
MFAKVAFVLVAVAALLLAGCEAARERREARQSSDAAALQSSGDSSSGCGLPAERGSRLRSIESGGVERSLRLYVPERYDPNSPAPLVLNFHGFGSNALEQERYSAFPELADREGFIVATPDGTNTPRRWYIYGVREDGYVDDFAFVDDLIDSLGAELCIDPARVYATGISNGGGMSAQLGCKLNGRIAAIAPVAGSPYSERECRDEGPMPVIAFHGTDDELVPFEGGPGGRLGLSLNSVRDNMKGWAGHNRCDMTIQTKRIAADVVLESYGNCDAGADVHLYVIEGGGHTWPGSDRNISTLGHTTQSISATELAWQFFVAHARTP